MEPVATEPAVEFVGLLPERRQPETRHGAPVPAAVAPPVSALKDRRSLWSFASGTVFGATVCVILFSTLTNSAPPPSEPSAGGPPASSSTTAPVSIAAAEMPSAAEPILVSNLRPDPQVAKKVSLAPASTPRSQDVRKLPVPSPPIEARKASFVGSLRVDSTPQGARVFINRQAAGVTPLVVPALGAGSHAVRVEADGYLSWSSAIRVIADRQNFIHTALTPIDSAPIPR